MHCVLIGGDSLEPVCRGVGKIASSWYLASYKSMVCSVTEDMTI